MILFHDNVIHRGTLALRSHRDVLGVPDAALLFQRQALRRPTMDGLPFEHEDVNVDPRKVKPELELEPVSAP